MEGIKWTLIYGSRFDYPVKNSNTANCLLGKQSRIYIQRERGNTTTTV